ncbi:MAG: nucleotidyltransferase family protein [Clostridia bacterium]|nr:nucleotidyltransferase family protein [Clostridia bacterium]
MHDFSIEQQTLIRLTALSLGKTAQEGWSFEDVDFEKLLQEANAQTVTLAAFERLSAYKKQLPVDIYKRWLKTSSRISQKNFAVEEGQKQLISLLTKENIPYIIIKGTSAAAYYPQAGHRALGDVDFLVREEDLTRATALLLASEYRQIIEDGEHDCHLVFTKENVRYEMHFETVGIPYGDTGKKIRDYLKEAPLEGEEILANDYSFQMPKPANHGLIMMLHMQHHMLGEGLGLRHLCDWGCFVDKTCQESFWKKELLPFLKEIGLYRYAQVMTATCHRYLSTACPEWAHVKDGQVCEEVMEDLLTGGNFGKKDELRSQSGMLISRHGKNGTKDGAGKNLFSILHESVKKKYPIVKKFPPVYPFLFLWRGVRYGVLMLFGRRKSIAKMLPEAEKRKNIYQKLHIFEINESEE